jgi:murein DD-endopeptidase MepM/ murein hydrolase activator NlpD
MPKKVKLSFPLEPSFDTIVPFLGHASKKNYRMGYGWHTGEDYIYSKKKDRGLGEPVLSIADGIVIHTSPIASPKGYGELIVVHYPQFNLWARYAHLEKRLITRVDAQVEAGQPLGTMGISGTDNVHLHFDLARVDLTKVMSSTWRLFPTSSVQSKNGYSKAQVLQWFYDPYEFYKKWGLFDE